MKKEYIVILVLVLVLIGFYVFGKGKGGEVLEEENRLFKIKAWFGDETFTVSHPNLGSFDIVRPNDVEGRFNLLKDTEAYNLGWQMVPGRKVVVSLVHKGGAIFSEVYIIDLINKDLDYYSENQEVVIYG